MITFQWRREERGTHALSLDGEDVAAISYIERDGRHGWYWHTYVNGDEGFCEELEEAKAEAERSTSPHRVN